jgi:hypothetical protein
LKHPKWQRHDWSKKGNLWTDEMVTLIRDRLRDEDQAHEVREGEAARTVRKARRQNKDMMPDERMGIMGVPLFPFLSAGDFAPPQLHGQMGLTNAILERVFSSLMTRLRS